MSNKAERSRFTSGITKYSRTSSGLLTGNAKDYLIKKHLHYYYPASDGAGEISAVTGFGHNIIERKNAFPLLNSDPVIKIYMASQTIFANTASEQLFPDLHKKGAQHPLLAGLEEIIQTFRQGKQKECSREVHIKGKWYLLAFSFAADSQSVRIYGWEITKYKIARDELPVSKKKITTDPDSVTDAYMACDQQWHIVDMNVQMEKLLGLDKDKLVGEIFWGVFPEMKQGEFVRQFRKAMADNTPVHFEAESVSHKWYEAHAYPSIDGLSVYLCDITRRKQAEEASQKSEGRFAVILDSIGDAVIIADIEGKISFMNAMAEQITGWKFQKALLKPIGEVFHVINEQTRGEEENPIKIVVETGVTLEPVNRSILVRKDKTEVSIDESAAPIKDQQGDIISVAVVFRDVTERRKREAILHQLNRTPMALSNSNQALMRADDELTYMKEVCRIIREDCGHAMVWIGFVDNEVKSVRPVASDGFEEGHPETLKITRKDTEYCCSVTGTAVLTCKPCVCLNMHTDSRFRPWRKEAKKLGYASAISFPLISGGRAFGVLTIYSSKPDSFQEDEIKLLSELSADLANGITTLRLRVEHARAEETSHRAKEYWGRTFDAVPDMIAIIDNNFHIIQANKAMVDRLGLTPHSCIGQICYKIVHGTVSPPSFCPHKKTMTDRLDHSVEVKEKLLDGDFTISTSPLFEQDGRMIGSVHVARDITKFKQTESALTDQAAKLQEHTALLEGINKELESFSYTVSHDLRAPLRAIDGYSRMILRDQIDKLDEEAKRKFKLIRSNAQMMDKLIDDYLSFSRLGRMEINMTRLSMEDLINDVWKDLQIISPERQLILKINDIALKSWGDRSLIRQVYYNLLSNAVKYTKFNKIANIETGGYPQGYEDVYYVKDNGVGFDMSCYDKLFGVFQRLHSADEYEGTGVGLAIVRRIIHRHGGRVWAEGEEGKGATFYFTLLKRD